MHIMIESQPANSICGIARIARIQLRRSAAIILALACGLLPRPGRADSLTFNVQNILAAPAAGAWMLNINGNPFQESDYYADNPQYAYAKLGFLEGNPIPSLNIFTNQITSTSVFIRADSPLVHSNSDMRIQFGRFTYPDLLEGPDIFRLTGFSHRNMVRPGDPWNILHEAGDFREYSGGACDILMDGQLQLRATNCVFEQLVPYPAPFGPGTPATASGWGTIDTQNSDPAWVQAFGKGMGKLNFVFQSQSAVLQLEYGLYTVDLMINPPEYVSHMVAMPITDNQWHSFAACGMGVQVVANTVNPASQLASVISIQSDETDLTSTLSNRFLYLPLKRTWHVENNCVSTLLNLAFDTTGLSAGVVSRLRVLERNTLKQFTNSQPWTLLTNTLTIVSNTVVLSNLTNGGQFLLAADFTSRILSVAPGSVELGWDEVAGASSYTVFTGDLPAPTAQWAVAATVTNALSCRVPRPANGKCYYVKAQF